MYVNGKRNNSIRSKLGIYTIVTRIGCRKVAESMILWKRRALMRKHKVECVRARNRRA